MGPGIKPEQRRENFPKNFQGVHEPACQLEGVSLLLVGRCRVKLSCSLYAIRFYIIKGLQSYPAADHEYLITYVVYAKLPPA